jgi:hypothetical protein
LRAQAAQAATAQEGAFMASASRRVLMKLLTRSALGGAFVRMGSGSATAAQGERPAATPDGTCMATLHIHLQEGFANDQVIVTVDGQTVFEAEVSTNLMRGRAATFDAPVPQGTITVEVLVSTRELRGAIDIDARDVPYLGCGMRDGAIEFRPTDQPVPYF